MTRFSPTMQSSATMTQNRSAAARPRTAADPWYYVFGPDPARARLTLICLPCAGGSAAMYAPWAPLLPADLSIAAVRLPGREARLAEPAFDHMDPFVAAFLPTLRRLAQRPYALVGHSMGALMSYALVKAIQSDGTIPLPDAVVLSAHRPPHLDLGRKAIYQDSDADFLDAVTRMGGLPEEVLAHRELLDLVLPTMRADFQLCETYPRGEQIPPHPAVQVPVTVIGAQDDHTATPESLRRWADLCPHLRDVHIFPGDHFYLRPHQTAVVEIVRTTVAG